MNGGKAARVVRDRRMGLVTVMFALVEKLPFQAGLAEGQAHSYKKARLYGRALS